jgi:hypothetical protein
MYPQRMQHTLLRQGQSRMLSTQGERSTKVQIAIVRMYKRLMLSTHIGQEDEPLLSRSRRLLGDYADADYIPRYIYRR